MDSENLTEKDVQESGLLKIIRKYVGSVPTDMNTTSWEDMAGKMEAEIHAFLSRQQADPNILYIPALYRSHYNIILRALSYVSEECSKIAEKSKIMGEPAHQSFMTQKVIEINEIYSIINNALIENSESSTQEAKEHDAKPYISFLVENNMDTFLTSPVVVDLRSGVDKFFEIGVIDNGDHLVGAGYGGSLKDLIMFLRTKNPKIISTVFISEQRKDGVVGFYTHGKGGVNVWRTTGHASGTYNSQYKLDHGFLVLQNLRPNEKMEIRFYYEV